MRRSLCLISQFSQRHRPTALLLASLVAALWLGWPATVLGQRDDLTGGSFYPTTLGGQISSSRFISVLQIVKVDRDKGVIHYQKVADLKGVNPQKTIRHDVPPDDPDGSNILQWAEPTRIVIQFGVDPLSRFCVGDCWYGYSNTFEHWYAMPALPVTYSGPVEKLRHAITEILAGREVVITAREWDDHFPDRTSPAYRDWLRGKRGRIWRIKAGLHIDSRTIISETNPRVFVGWGIGGPDIAPTLIASLKTGDARARCAAAENLGQIGPVPGSVPALIQALQDADEYVRIFAAEALLRLEPKQKPALATLVQALKHEARDIRAIAAESLGSLGETAGAAVGDLVATLEAREPWLRAIAISALIRIRQRARLVVPAFAEALHDDNDAVRDWAAKGLVKFGRHTREAFPQLLEALKPGKAIDDRCLYECFRWYGEHAVPSLCTALKNGHLAHPDSCIAFLGELGPAASAAVPTLLACLKDKEPWVRLRAAGALLQIEPTRSADVLPILKALLRDKNQNRVDIAAGILGQLGPKAAAAVPDLIGALQDTSEPGRYSVLIVMALSQMGPKAKAAVPLLCQVLQNKEAGGWTRQWSAKALAILGDRAAIPALEKVLRDEDDSIRADAAVALWKLSGKAEPSVALLTKLLAGDDEDAQGQLATHLREMGPAAKAAAPALRKLLASKNVWVRLEAALALWHIGEHKDEALNTLIAALQNDEVPTEAAKELAALGPEAKAAMPALTGSLKHHDVNVRIAAAVALGQIGEGDAEALPVLIQALRDRDRWACKAAAHHLGDWGRRAKPAIPALIRALDHDDFYVYQAVGQALKKIDPQAAARAGVR